MNPIDRRSVDQILQFFAFEHLPPHLQAMSRPFADVARKLAADDDVRALERALIHSSQASSLIRSLQRDIDSATPANPEATAAVVKIDQAAQMLLLQEPLHEVLRRLLEAKDCAVRALLYREPA